MTWDLGNKEFNRGERGRRALVDQLCSRPREQLIQVGQEDTGLQEVVSN